MPDGNDKRVARSNLTSWKGRERYGPVAASQPSNAGGLDQLAENALR
jgi:hypothetical protein